MTSKIGNEVKIQNENDISPKQWSFVEAYFKKYPKETELDKTKSKGFLSHTFINVSVEGQRKNQIFVLRENLGAGGFALVKRCQNRDGQQFAVKIEGEIDEKRNSDFFIQAFKENDLSKSMADRFVQRKAAANKNAVKNKKTEDQILKGHGFLIGTAVAKRPKNTLFSPKLAQRDDEENKENLDINQIQDANVVKNIKYTIIPLLSGGTLKQELDWINAHRKLSKDEKEIKKLKIFKEAVEQVKLFNQKGIIHADIKAENFMLETKHGKVRLNDFGLSKLASKNNQIILQEKNKPVVEGTPQFIAPEIERQGRYSVQSDLWALAQMLKLEFKHKNPGLLKDMMEKILDLKNPNQRPSIDAFLDAIELQIEDLNYKIKAEKEKIMIELNQLKQEQLANKSEVEVKKVEPKLEEPVAVTERTFYTILTEMAEKLSIFQKNQELKLAKHSAVKSKISYFEGLILQRALDGVAKMLSSLMTVNEANSKPTIIVAKLNRDLVELQKISQRDNNNALFELCNQLNVSMAELKQDKQAPILKLSNR